MCRWFYTAVSPEEGFVRLRPELLWKIEQLYIQRDKTI